MRNYFQLIWLLVICSCVEPFEYVPENFDKLLVVDGSISDEAKSHIIQLSFTFPIDEETSEPVSNAEVFVETASGDRIVFAESENGIYQSPPNFKTISGASYQLFINTSDGKMYQSSVEQTPSSVPIDSIHDRYEEILSTDVNQVNSGVQFFIDSHSDEVAPQFFRYSWEETYQIIVPNPSFYDFNPADSTTSLREMEVGVCYNSNVSDDLTIGSTAGNLLNRVSSLPVRFVGIENDVLRNRYSLNVNQFSISKKAHDFYRKIKELNETGGSLFDKQLGVIASNIVSLSNPDEPVLGYFEVAAVTKKRAFFNARDFESPFLRPQFRFNCDADDLTVTEVSNIPGLLLSTNRNRLLGFTVDGRAIIAPRTCSDCTWYSNNEKPDFWID